MKKSYLLCLLFALENEICVGNKHCYLNMSNINPFPYPFCNFVILSESRYALEMLRDFDVFRNLLRKEIKKSKRKKIPSLILPILPKGEKWKPKKFSHSLWSHDNKAKKEKKHNFYVYLT